MMTELETKLLALLKGLLADIEGLMGESSGVYGLHMNGDVSPWDEINEGGRFERLTHLSSARAAIAEAEIDRHDIGSPVHMKILVTRPHCTYWSARRISEVDDVAATGATPREAICRVLPQATEPMVDAVCPACSCKTAYEHRTEGLVYCASCGQVFTPKEDNPRPNGD